MEALREQVRSALGVELQLVPRDPWQLREDVEDTHDYDLAYYRYDFLLGTNFFDYPHLGAWPDGYYVAFNVFNPGGTAFLGPPPRSAPAGRPPPP